MSFYHFSRQVSTNLAANISQCILGLALIPLATRILGPEDYGVYGMAIVIEGLMVALCETGAAYVLYAQYADLSEKDQRVLLSSMVSMSLVISVIAAFVLWSLWEIFSKIVPLLKTFTGIEVLLLCFAIPVRTVLGVTSPILIAQKRSNWIAAGVFLKAIVSFSAVLLALYLFSFGRSSLFLGNSFGTLAFTLLTLVVIGPSLWALPDLKWIRRIVFVTPGAWFAALLDNLRNTVESSTIAYTAGSVMLGNYSHARLHYSLLMQGTNAMATVIWPYALREAKDDSSDFGKLRVAWNIVYIALSICGLIFVFFGGEIISLLTNGKFNFAADWVPFLIIYLLIQQAGKPATAVLFAQNKGNTYSGIRIFSTLFAIICLLMFVPYFGMVAVLSVLICEMFVMRIFVQLYARFVRADVPFQDHWIVVGIFLIVGAYVWLRIYDVSEMGRAIGLLIIAAPLGFMLVRSLSEYIAPGKFVRNILNMKVA